MKIFFLAFPFLLVSCTSSTPVLASADQGQLTPVTSAPETVPITFLAGHPTAGESLASSIDQFSKSALDRNLSLMKRYKSIKFEIVGFTDNAECAGEFCQKLAQSRADIVFRWFLENGISRSAFSAVVGKGSEMPIADNSTNDGQTTNRRVEVNIMP